MDDIKNLKVHESICKVIEQFGKGVIKESRFISILSDYGAFNEAESIKLIIKVLQSKGYCSQLLGLDGNKSEQPLKMASYIQEVTEIYGFQRKYVEYAIKSVVRGLGWNVEFGNNVSEGNRKVSKRKCRKCGAEVPEGAKYCIECGKYFEEIEVPMMCPSCGKKALEGAKFCGKCGARMPEAIDLGLSVRWASCNVGTASPEGYGGYYGWADPTGTKTKTKLIYYPSANPPSSISGTKYDIARAKWGGKWRLPTKAEQQELADKCTWTWTTQNGVNGYKVVGKNGNSIFLPAAGYRGGTDVVSVGTRGYYWSGTLNQCNADHAYHLYFYDYGSHDVDRNDRNRGFTVRPVVE